MSENKFMFIGGGILFFMLMSYVGAKLFSEENQNRLMRSITTTIGYKNGEVRVYAGQAHPVFVVKGVEKLTTAVSSAGSGDRPYRFGFGYVDKNLNGKIDLDEKELGKKYFEIGPFTQYVYLDASEK